MEFEAMMEAISSVKIEDVQHDCRPFLVVYKDGQVQRFAGTATVPPSLDTFTGVDSKDVVINPETGLSVRLYKPQSVTEEEKVGVVVYYHGGGFCCDTVASPMYHNYCNILASKSNMIVVSVDYRRPPEDPLPIAYNDSWEALQWLSMSEEPWVKDHSNLANVFLGGDSAGANIAHHMAKRLGAKQVEMNCCRITLKGLLLVCPYFWGKERIGSEEMKLGRTVFDPLVLKLWSLACPESRGFDDPLIDPGMDEELRGLGVDRVVVYVAEEDVLRDRGLYYKEVLLKSGWKGSVEVVETIGEHHVFHLMNPSNPKSEELLNHVVEFLTS